MENDPPQTDHSSNVEFCTPQRRKLRIMRKISRAKQAQEPGITMKFSSAKPNSRSQGQLKKAEQHVT
jgi:hypothetical protein